MKHYLYKRWPPLIIWLLIIFLAANNPNPFLVIEKTITKITLFDVSFETVISAFIRIFTFQILSVLITRALVWNKECQVLHLTQAFVTTLIYALMIEGYQTLTSNNLFSYFNILMAGWGALLGILVYLIWRSPRLKDEVEQNLSEKDLLL